MTTNILPKKGIPVLAYSTSDPLSQRLCCLFLRYSNQDKQASIILQSSIPIHGFDDEQSFSLLIDADNMVPATNSLAIATMSLAPDQVDKIARSGGTPDLRTLSLTIKKPCPIWCPSSCKSIAPKHGFDSPFHQFVKLIGASEVHVLFDYKWIHWDNRAPFQRIISHPEAFVRFPVDKHYEKYCWLADSSVFSPVQDVVSDAPPPYTNTPNKRGQSATSSTPEYPSPKRVLLSQNLSCPPSPTEKATTVSTPTPKPPSSPVTNPPDSQEAIKRVVEALLPAALLTILPDILPRIFTVPPSSPSPSPQSPNPSPNLMSSLRTLIGAHLAAHAEAKLQEVYTETLDHAVYLRSAADVEFHEILDEKKLDVTMTKDDGIAELDHVIDDKLDEFKQRAAEIADEVGEHAEKAYADVCERLDELIERETACLRRHKEVLKWGPRILKEEMPSTECNLTRSRGRRAISLPF